MNQTAKYLSKRRSDSGYSELRKMMLEDVQKMSGHIWTDYNLHDPGVTILEQLCYALTDINYRSDYSVEDLLTNRENLIELHQHGMFTPEESMPCRPLTVKDYQKYFIDRIQELDYVLVKPANITLSPQSNGQENKKLLITGLYDVYIKPQFDAGKHVSNNTGKENSSRKNTLYHENIKQKILYEYSKVRNIGEDINEIIFIEDISCELVADIEVDDSRSSIDIVCDIYYKVYKMLSGRVSKLNIYELENQGEMLSDLLSGPLLTSGYVTDEVLDKISDKISLSRLVANVRNISGVVNVKSLAIETISGEVYSDYLPALSSVCHRLLIPSRQDEIRLRIKINDKTIELDFYEFATSYEMLLHNECHLEKSVVHKFEKSNQTHYGPILNDYFSVQAQFPDVYGINQSGVPASFSTERKSMALQLKGYMMQFDQLMSDHLAMLDNIRDFFSINMNAESSYKTQALDENSVPDLEKLYDKRPDKEFLSSDDSYENFPERKNRVFDYLLALNGREKELYGFEYKNPYFTKTELMDFVLISKCNNLRHIHNISGNRSGAYNYNKPCWGNRNVSAFEKYILNMIGVDVRCRSFVYPLTKKSISYSYKSESCNGIFSIENPENEEKSQNSIQYYFIKIDYDKDKFSEILSEKRKNFTIVPHISVTPERSSIFFDSIKNRFIGEENNLPQFVLCNGVNLDNYRVGHIMDNSGFDVIFNTTINSDMPDKWNYIASFKKLNEAFEAVNLLRYYFVQLNLEMEGMHMIEHNLLLPVSLSGRILISEDTDKEFYTHQVSIVLPDWSARFSDPDFRMYVENIIRSECPAHIYANIHWIEFNKMEKFELIFKNWLMSKCENIDTKKINYLSNKLYRFLKSLDRIN